MYILIYMFISFMETIANFSPHVTCDIDHCKQMRTENKQAPMIYANKIVRVFT